MVIVLISFHAEWYALDCFPFFSLGITSSLDPLLHRRKPPKLVENQGRVVELLVNLWLLHFASSFGFQLTDCFILNFSAL